MFEGPEVFLCGLVALSVVHLVEAEHARHEALRHRAVLEVLEAVGLLALLLVAAFEVFDVGLDVHMNLVSGQLRPFLRSRGLPRGPRRPLRPSPARRRRRWPACPRPACFRGTARSCRPRPGLCRSPSSRSGSI